MAIGTPVVIDTQGSGVATTSLTFTVPAGGVPAGATIFIAASLAEASSAHVVADTAGNTYALDTPPSDVNAAATDLEFQLWRSSTGGALSSGNTIVLSWTSSVANVRATSFYVTGLAASPLDQAAVAEGSSSTPSSGNITTTQNDEILIGISGSGSAAALTEDGNFTSIAADGNARAIAAAYRIVSATETMDYSPTYAVSENWTCGIASYKAASTGAVGRGLLNTHKLAKRRLY